MALLTNDDKVLIRALRLQKGWSSSMMREFPITKMEEKHVVSRLYGSTNCCISQWPK